MDRLESMRIFVTVAGAAGFAPAARRLGLSPPAVTRAVAALERRLGTRLLHRTTRVVRLTEAGERYVADCRRILAEVEDAEAAAAGSHRELRGGIGVTASAMFGRLHVAPLVLDFLRRHPGVELRTLFVDRVVNLLEEGMDVAVRIAHLPDSSLTAIRVGSVRRVVCAAPAYLAARGTPAAPGDLAGHDVVSFGGISPTREWTFREGSGSAAVRVTPRFTTNLPDVAIAAAREGHGLTRLLSYMVAGEFARGTLAPVLVDWEPPPIPIQVVHGAGRHASARVRACIDHLVAGLRHLDVTPPAAGDVQRGAPVA
jgi:DNA-binding transcriptional LysR family regulator